MVESKRNWRRAAWQAPALVILSTVAALTVNAVRTEHLPLIGDFSAAARMTTTTGERIDISLFEAQKLFANKAGVFIDARSTDDYLRG